MIQGRARGEWMIPESIVRFAKLEKDYLDATAAVDDNLKSTKKAADDIHNEYSMLIR